MYRDSFLPIKSAGVLLAALLAVTGCGGEPPSQEAPPPAEVGVETAVATTVAEVHEFVGTVQAFRRVEVRSAVAGIITARPFREGAEVRSGEVLYEIDRTIYQAAAASAAARLANAERLVKRLTPLVAEKAVAQRDLDDAETELLRARADHDRAAKDLSDATVRAEISGRVGRAQVELGGRVSGSEDLLTTIDQLEPIYVSFRPSSQQMLEWSRSSASAALLRPGSSLKVSVELPDGATLPRTGVIDYVDPVMEPGSGTQEIRARFTNADRLLVPGQFVRVRLEGFVLGDALTVPQRAVQQQLGRRVIYLVGPGDTVLARDIEVGSWTGDRWVVTSGLSVGDRVIVDGIQKTGPGAVVTPVPVAVTDSNAVATASRP
ncbi:MAG: efflux RND transporter periplasmic adaptor subunit [Gemmatimonadales bacterium]|nr:efflux RND transporter periplasmic adaptor subunit [Gemmatimonadales bacterium]MDZ4388504.1 efflux RND transporter periplasmic adaptor subunit [Gemmatimonadales bacterium]